MMTNELRDALILIQSTRVEDRAHALCTVVREIAIIFVTHDSQVRLMQESYDALYSVANMQKSVEAQCPLN